jgi:hypothetical protein
VALAVTGPVPDQGMVAIKVRKVLVGNQQGDDVGDEAVDILPMTRGGLSPLVVALESGGPVNRPQSGPP